MAKVNTVDEFMAAQTTWQSILQILREILLQTELEETIKWGVPTYTLDGKNVVGLGSFKSYAGLWFHQGVFLQDKANVLINAQEGVTKALRQWRITDPDDIDEKLVLQYVKEAIENQKQGKELKPEKKKLELPRELKTALDGDSKLKEAYKTFTDFKKREFAEYIGSAKREQTRQDRLQKIIPMILAGKGLHDKYR